MEPSTKDDPVATLLHEAAETPQRAYRITNQADEHVRERFGAA